MNYYRLPILALCLSVCLGMSACKFPPRIHKLEVQQGNAITPDMLTKLQIGLSKEEVSQIMGISTLQQVLDPDRLDYYYSLKTDDGRVFGEKLCTLFFKRDKLLKVAYELKFQPNSPQAYIQRVMGTPSAKSSDNRRWDYVFHLPIALGQKQPVYYSFWFAKGKLVRYELIKNR